MLLDTTYFGRDFGVMAAKDAASGKNLLAAAVKRETVALYRSAVDELQERGCRVLAVVCDGRRGLATAFGGIPVQMCQFHQIAIVRRSLTRKPKSPAAAELWEITLMLPRVKQEVFDGALSGWQTKWAQFLEERRTSPATGRTRYAHPRLRSAFLSLRRNLPLLFTCLRYPTLRVPNTTNLLDGHFADLKNKLRNHNGLSRNRKIDLIFRFLSPSIIHHFVP